MSKIDFPSVNEFFIDLLGKAKLFTEKLPPFLFQYNSIEIKIRIYFWLACALICIFLLLKIIFFPSKKKANKNPLLNNSTFLNTLNNYNINYNLGDFIRKLLKGDQNHENFFREYKYFEKTIDSYAAENTFSLDEEKNLNLLKQKLNFTTLNPNFKFTKTSQLHVGCILRIIVPDKEYSISFESKVIDNCYSYLLLTYPQINNENHSIPQEQKIILETILNQDLYSWEAAVFKNQLEKTDEEAGLKISHSNQINKIK